MKAMMIRSKAITLLVEWGLGFPARLAVAAWQGLVAAWSETVEEIRYFDRQRDTSR